MKRCFAAILALVVLLTVFSASAAEYATVTGGWLRLRSYPSYDSQTIASYYTGTQVEVLKANGEWYHVRLSDGNEGYMLGQFLNAQSGAPNTPSGGYSAAPGVSLNPGGTNATLVSSNGYGIRMRMGPGTSYGVIRKYPVGTAATIVQSSKSWCKVTIGDQTGYIMTQYLSTANNGGTGSGTTSRSIAPLTYAGDATVWSGNGYGVRLRTGPGKEYDPIGVYSVGAKVKIIARGDVWDHVQVGSRTGYMMNEFLLYNDHYRVTAVTTNNLKPVVGNTLAVQSVTPSTATVTYEWLVKTPDGKETVKGLTAAYPVTEADIGSTIRLRITGTGSYRGSVSSTPTQPVGKTGTVESLTLSTLNPHVGDVLKPVIVPADASVTYHWTVNGESRGTGSTYTVAAGDAGHTITLKVEGKPPFTGSVSAVTNPVLVMNAPLIETSGMPHGRYQTQYRQQLTAIGGGECRWSLIKGALPVGLALDLNGVISGTPTECGTKTFTVQVSNGMGSDSKELIMTVDKMTVSLPTIEGVTPPTKGGLPVSSITATDQYTGTVSWTPAPASGAFDAATAYTAQIDLVAKPNYTFAGLTPSFFTVSGSSGVSCTIGSDGTTATVTAPFPATAGTGAVKLSKPVIGGIEKQGDVWVISWSAVEHAAGYMLRICNQEWLACSSTNYTLEGVPASGTYQVFAVGDNESYSDSDTADYVFTLPVAIPLNTPTGLRIEPSGDGWLLRWDPVVNALSYSVCLPGSTAFQPIGDSTSHMLTKEPQPGEIYQVYATGDGTYYTTGGTAALTYSVPVITLSTPAGFEILKKDGAWVAVWESVANATGYRLEDPQGNKYPCTQTSYTFTVEPEEGYYYVTAIGDGATLLDSEAAYFDHSTAVALPLPAPKNLLVQQKDGAWVAEWEAVRYAAGYRFRINEEPWIVCETNSYTFPGEPAATAVYTVCAIGDGTFFLDSAELAVEHNAALATQQPLPEDEATAVEQTADLEQTGIEQPALEQTDSEQTDIEQTDIEQTDIEQTDIEQTDAEEPLAAEAPASETVPTEPAE